MRQMKMLAVGVFLLFSSSIATADIMSNGTGGGNWSSRATWSGGVVPTGSETIIIQSTDSIYIDVPVTITGTLRCLSGRIDVFDSSQFVFGNGGVYEDAVDGGRLPKATWNMGSTCLITGVATAAPSNGNQNFYNMEWNCPNQNSNLNLGWNGNIIGGNIVVDSTGNSRWQMCAPKSADGTTPDTSSVTINGNITISGGAFTSNGTSNSLTVVLITQKGSINVTGGNFGVSRGSGPDVVWRLGGDFNVSNATIQNSGGTTKDNALIFTANTTHTLALNNATFSGGLTFVIDSGSTLEMGTSQIPSSNTGSFIVSATATMATGDSTGINVVQCTGERGGAYTGNHFDIAANYVFNGTAAQVTGTQMPATVNNLTIANPAGVTLSQATTINGVLDLKAGVFDNTTPFTLGPGGSIALDGGSLKVPTSVKQTDDAIPHTFFVDQNYPNPFNPSTTIQFGLPEKSFVVAKVYSVIGQEVATLFSGYLNAGVHALNFDASHLSSGIYLYRIQTEKSVKTNRMILLK
jgi:Secretion system C-terminal sorting domain